MTSYLKFLNKRAKVNNPQKGTMDLSIKLLARRTFPNN